MAKYHMVFAGAFLLAGCQQLQQVSDAVQTQQAVSRAAVVVSDKTAPFSTKAAAVACAAQSGFNWLADYMRAHHKDPKAVQTISNFSAASGQECK